MNTYIYIGFIMIALIGITGCSQLNGVSVISGPQNNLITVNGTPYDPSRSFQLQSFADSCSVKSGPVPSDLNCSSGDPSMDFRFNSTTGNWTMKCCDFKASKCYWYNSTNIFSFNESHEYQNNILGTKYEDGYGVMCCNSKMSECVWQKPGLNGSYDSCGSEYDQLITSVVFNVSGTNEWGVVACIDGFI